ncbi:MAG: regulatory protein RecX [Solirubrobacteraceae bacterium]
MLDDDGRRAVSPGATGEVDLRLEHALGLACADLNRRSHTVSEVALRLARNGVAEDVVQAAIESLVAANLLDDERFARAFVSDKRELGQWGSDRIRRGLLARGIAPELAAAALEQPVPAWGQEPQSELERALELLRRRFPTAPHDRRERERALGVLLRKGYDSELALDAMAAHRRGE